MKFIHFGVIAALSLISLASLSTACSATSDPAPTASSTPESVTDQNKPSLDELKAAVSRIKNIRGYSEFQALSNAELERATPYAKEYRYLFRLAATAEKLVANYDQSDSKLITSVIQASKDAEIGCNYRFGVVRENYLTSQTPDAISPTTPAPSDQASNSAAQDTTKAPTSQKPATKTEKSSATSTVATLTTSTAKSPSSADQTTTSTTENTDTKNDTQAPTVDETIPVPATGLTNSETASSSNMPLIITLTLVAIACILIGSMIILNRRKPYRPGRKF